MTGPLTHLVVLDLTRGLSGPYCTMTLKNLGAEVLKIERPNGGDFVRGNGPFVDDVSVYFESINRGKRSISLNLSNEAGKETLLALADKADVLIENFLPGTMKKLGLDYTVLHERNPQLVYAAVSGFGQTGPYAPLPSFDIIVQGMGGIMTTTGTGDGQPMRPGASLGDIDAGLFATIGILAALQSRTVTGEGQMVDISMLDCQIAVQENAFSRYLMADEMPVATGARHAMTTPFQAFKTKDSYVTVAVVGGVKDQWPLFCSAINRMDLADDPRFATSYLRSVHYDELNGSMSPPFIEKTTNEWITIFRELEIPVGPINTIPDTVRDPQVKERDMIVDLEHPKLGTVHGVGNPIKLSATPGEIGNAAPELGIDTEEILQNYLHYTQKDITNLHDRGALSE
jgi:CoA:oxalate CoA-transferase